MSSVQTTKAGLRSRLGKAGVAVVVLALLTGGTSYASVQLGRNSVKARHIAAGAVASSEVKDHSLKKADFKPGQLPAGARGPAGPAGSSALTPLRAGETIYGYVSGIFDSPRANGAWAVSASFPIPAADSPAEVWVDGVTNGDPCSGTASVPTAPANTVCVYQTFSYNPSAGGSSHYAFEVTRFGFGIGWRATEPGYTEFSATWAFTEG